jgi:hypothetical protein
VLEGYHAQSTGEGYIRFELPLVGRGITGSYAEEGPRCVERQWCEVFWVAEGGLTFREGCLLAVEKSLSYSGAEPG